MFSDFIKMVLIPISVVILGALIGSFFSSCYSAKVYNKINNTTWTCTDFFFAANQINSNTQTLKLTK